METTNDQKTKYMASGSSGDTDSLVGASFSHHSHAPSALTLINRTLKASAAGSASAATTSSSSLATSPSVSAPLLSNTAVGSLGTLTSLGAISAFAAMASGLNSHKDVKDLSASMKSPVLSTKASSSGVTITPVPNIKPIISITPVLSSPPNRQGSSASTSGHQNSVICNVPVPPLSQSTRVRSRKSSSQIRIPRVPASFHHYPQQQQQMTPMPLAANHKSSAVSIMNGKVDSRSHVTGRHSSAVEGGKVHLSGSESHTGESSAGCASSGFSGESSDEDRDRDRDRERHPHHQQHHRAAVTHVPSRDRFGRHAETQHLRNMANAKEMLGLPHSNDSHDKRMLSNISMALGLPLPNSITVTPVMSSSHPSDLNAPLNLSMKPSASSSSSTSQSHSSHATASAGAYDHRISSLLSTTTAPYRGAKRGPKPKSLKMSMSDGQSHLRQRQEELRAHLEAQFRHQHQMQSKLVSRSRGSAHHQQQHHHQQPQHHHQPQHRHHSQQQHQAGVSSTPPPQIHIQTSTMGQGKSLVITTTSPSSSSGGSPAKLPAHHHHHGQQPQQRHPTIITTTTSSSPSSTSTKSPSRPISLLANYRSSSSSAHESANPTAAHSGSHSSQQQQQASLLAHFGRSGSGGGGSSSASGSNGTSALSLIRKGHGAQDEGRRSRDSAAGGSGGNGDAADSARSRDEKKLVAKFRTLDAAVESSEEESSGDDSSEESESSSGSDSSGDSEGSTSGTDRSRGTTSSHSRGQKRRNGSQSPPSKRKKHYATADERELRIPLEHGWRRLTKIRTYSYSGARGEVIYFAPCNKRLKTYPEVVRYLEKNSITDITRENFSFSSKHNVGEFLEPQGNGEYMSISELDVMARIEEFRARKARRYVPILERRSDEVEYRERKVRRKEEARMKRRQEEEAVEARRQKEHMRYLQHQERVEKQEQQRLEREAKAQQIIEARKKRQEMLEKQRMEEADRELKRLQAVVMREQELQKRREMLIMVDLERERRRQHMLLVKALEAKKKQEEKDRVKEERLAEKRLARDRKLEQRRAEMQIIREMKKPVEDMELAETDPLPNFNRIPGVKLPGKAFADALMVFEFLHNFGEALGFDMDGLPSLNTLQMGLLNTETFDEELMSVLHHLMTCVIDDPGIPPGAREVTSMGLPLKDVDITANTVSEVLRIYIQANEGEDCKMLQWIGDKPFMALNPTQKAAILAYICNELLGSRSICRQIDNNIEFVNNMRRDKWIVEGKVRKLRMIHGKKLARQQIRSAITGPAASDDKAEATPTTADKDSVGGEKPDEGKTPGDKDDNADDKITEKKEGEDADEPKIDSGNESDSYRAIGQVEEPEEVEEEPGLTVEELGKKIDKMTRQHNLYRRKLQKATQQLRALSFGQDRYRRRLWMLPNAGGVYVEGLESAELDEDYVLRVEAGDEAVAAKSLKSEQTDEEEAEEEEEMEVDTDKNKVDEANSETTECKPKLDLTDGVVVNEDVDPDIKENVESELAEDAPIVRKSKDEQGNLTETEKDITEVKEESEFAEVKEEVTSIMEDVVAVKKEELEPKLEVVDECVSSVKDEKDDVVEDNCNDEKPELREMKLEKEEKMDVEEPGDLDKEDIKVKSETDRLASEKPESKFGGRLSDCVDKLSKVAAAETTFTPSVGGGVEAAGRADIPLFGPSLLHSPPLGMLLNGGGPLPKDFGKSVLDLMLKGGEPSASMSGFCSSLFSAMATGHAEAMTSSANADADLDDKPWLSMLPRIPCGETTLTPISGGAAVSAKGGATSTPLSSGSKAESTPTTSLGALLPPAFSAASLMSTSTTTTSATSPYSSSSSALLSKYSSCLPYSPLYFHPHGTPSSFASSLQMGLMNGSPSPLYLPPPGSGSFMSSAGGGGSSTLGASLGSLNGSYLVSSGGDPYGLGASPAPSQSERSTPRSTVTVEDSANIPVPASPPITEDVLEQLKQHKEALPIPLELQKGWWRITDSNQLKSMLQALHQRGIREKMLQIKLQKYLDMACEACNKATPDSVDLEITDMDREVSQKLGGTPDAHEDTDWMRNLALRAEVAVLEQVEAIEDRVASGSMQVKNWKISPKVTEDGARFRLITEEEEPESSDGDKSSLPCLSPLQAARERLLQLEENIERRYLKPPLGFRTNEVTLNSMSNKASVGNTVNAATSNSADGDSADVDPTDQEPDSPIYEEVTEGLMRWRAALQNCRTSSQLAVCLNYLESCIAWDRSIMKASCQFCNSGDNEGMLLLCDGCDKGYHTYCFKPKLETIPEGDWFCYECLNKATKERVCLFCGKKGKNICACDNCPKAYHTDCLEPPLSRVPKGKWLCPHCSVKGVTISKPKSRSRKSKDTKEPAPESDDTPKKSEKSSSKAEKAKEKAKVAISKDMGPCRALMAELETHEEAWPFLLPVNTKQFPSYRKIIKKPMDLSSIRNKLENGSYKSRGDFHADVSVIFDNCETFNEDDSPVGKAGHKMRAFFDAKWSDLVDK